MKRTIDAPPQRRWPNRTCAILTAAAAMSIALPAQTFTTLHSFCKQSGCPDGYQPSAGLIQGTSGNLYTTTEGGGTGGRGTVNKVTPSGTVTTLQSFDYSDGGGPAGGLVQATNGNFYGTTSYGGANSQGTVFKVTPGGVLTLLYSFCAQGGALCTDGASPAAGLVQATNGILYGTTEVGGSGNAGTVFKITPNGSLTTLYSFCAKGGSPCSDGSSNVPFRVLP